VYEIYELRRYIFTFSIRYKFCSINADLYGYRRNHTSISLISILIFPTFSSIYFAIIATDYTNITPTKGRNSERAGYAFTSPRIDAIDTPWRAPLSQEEDAPFAMHCARWTSAPKALLKVLRISFARDYRPPARHLRRSLVVRTYLRFRSGALPRET